MATALEARDVEFSYGRLQVLFGVSLVARDGEILALLGTNGAGKSTLLNVISGLERADRGTVLLRGEPITNVRAERLVGRGLAHVPGGRGVFPSLTVMDNLLAGSFTFMYRTRLVRARIATVLTHFPTLASKLRQPAGRLSGGEQHMLSLAKALLLEPTVLLIDELSATLAPQVVEEVLDLIRGMRADGKAIVLVEQSLNVAASIADRAVFMEKGAVTFEGTPDELIAKPELARAVFLGAPS
jgi:ABC-type branched-subunit amino acid transport system ATPase component